MTEPEKVQTWIMLGSERKVVVESEGPISMYVPRPPVGVLQKITFC